MRRKTRDRIAPWIAVAIFVALWWAAVRLFKIESYILPTPLEALRAMVQYAGALDTFTREELWEVLQGLWTKRRCTVVLVTHELREAVYLADTVHVMCARPGQVRASRSVGFARPRSLETTFEPAFVELVHDLRGHIGRGVPS